MKFKRFATARWEGSGKDGNGTLATQSTVLQDTQYSFNTRFADGVGTNPEELVAAAHAGCFAMQLSFNLSGIGTPPDYLDVRCELTFEDGSITNSHLILKASVPGVTQEQFDEQVAGAEKNCPISKLLNAKISVDAQLV